VKLAPSPARRPRRVLAIGLDCAPPSLLFERFASAMPTLRRLRARGSWGVLRSVVPPITVPAWACATTGLDAGELGLYGFRNRVERSYALRTATSEDVLTPHVWDRVAASGRRAAALFVPPSYPPRADTTDVADRLVEVSCMLAPGADVAHTHPSSLGAELTRRFGPYLPDLDRALTGEAALDGLFAMARQHFDVAEHVLATHDPALLFMVEIGTDRLNHLFWPLLDPADPRHTPDHPLTRRARDYYGYLDLRIERLLERSGPDTAVLVLSDHGARPILGGVHVNEHLRREGLLVLRAEPAPDTALVPALVDWSRTRAWSEGGYYARVFANVKGREPEGCVEPAELPALLERIAAGLATLPDPSGRGHRVLRPSETWRDVRGVPPDLLVFFGDLALRSLGRVGAPALVVGPDEVERERGRGGCNHDWDGAYVAAGPGFAASGERPARLADVAPTLASLLGLAAP
jgi:predicted AlkP superfamily phosphohydrolase/phosphomutase